MANMVHHLAEEEVNHFPGQWRCFTLLFARFIREIGVNQKGDKIRELVGAEHSMWQWPSARQAIRAIRIPEAVVGLGRLGW